MLAAGINLHRKTGIMARGKPERNGFVEFSISESEHVKNKTAERKYTPSFSLSLSLCKDFWCPSYFPLKMLYSLWQLPFTSLYSSGRLLYLQGN